MSNTNSFDIKIVHKHDNNCKNKILCEKKSMKYLIKIFKNSKADPYVSKSICDTSFNNMCDKLVELVLEVHS